MRLALPGFHKAGYILLLAAVIAFFFPGGCRKKPMTPVEQWQEKILAAHGGTETLARVSTLVYTGTISTLGGDKGTVELILSRPQKLRTIMKYRKRSEDRILLGKSGWRNFGAGFEEATGPSLDAMVFQYNHLSLPMGLIHNDYKITYSERIVGDRTFPALELFGGNGPPMTVTIDPDTGLIRLVEGRITTGPQEVLMAVGYADYREVSGVMLPHRIINFVNDKAIAESRFDSVAVNTQPDQSTYAVEPRAAAK